MKLVGLLIGLTITFQSFSQISLWPKIGANQAWTTYLPQYDHLNFVIDGNSPSNFGWYGGLMVNIPLFKNFSIRPEIIYNQLNITWNQQYTAHSNISTINSSRNERRQYISLPVNIVKHFKIGNNEFQITLGGYIGRSLNGGNFDYYYSKVIIGAPRELNDYNSTHGKLNAETATPTFIYGYPATYSSASYNPVDLGINAGVGYQIKKVLLTAQFGLGLSNTQPHYDDKSVEDLRDQTKTCNRSISLGLAYRVF